MKQIISIALVLSFIGHSFGQETTEQGSKLSDSSYVLSSVVNKEDTMPLVSLRTALIVKTKDQLRRDARTRRYVIKVYPYAKLAGDLFEAYEAELDSLTSEREKKRFMKQAENELREEFEGELRNLTITQGKILIKLVDRETGKSSYDIVKQMRGGMTAFFWQGLAKLFGTNLKTTYDKEGEDQYIEQIVQQIEAGEIYVKTRTANTVAARTQLEKSKKKKRKWLKSKK